MNAQDRTRLTMALREHVGTIAADLRTQMRDDSEVRERAKQLHRDEQVGENFDVWTDLLSRRAAVLWVLKSVYVRVLEDRRLLTPGRLLDREAQTLFEQLAPNLGDTAFLKWIYRDLASARGGLPELFSPQPAEVALPADALSRELIAFWRHKDPDTGAHWSFAEEKFEGELMGDLYQELDPVVKDRFALCQTPDFIRSFILDRTLTPAIEEFGADTVRLLDPACGSGHFLIDGLKRLVEATKVAHCDWAPVKVVTHCIDRVVGIDLNDYACALARARLVMTAAELAGVRSLAEAGQFHPHVYNADGLDQVEKDFAEQSDLLESKPHELRATLSRPEVRLTLSRVLKPRFHAVVGNPPYITEKDPARKAYHREKVGGTQRYVSAYQKYHLDAPFTERCFQLAEADAFLGLITSNSFMKREFGRMLIENVLAHRDLILVVDTSQAHIPHHGTATVTFFARNRAPNGRRVHAVMGKRGETVKPADPSKGRVWTSIAEGWACIGFENEFVSVAQLSRETLKKHPWSLSGGGANTLKSSIETRSTTLGSLLVAIGFASFPGQDEVFLFEPSALRRLTGRHHFGKRLVDGERTRNWTVDSNRVALAPYSGDFSLVALDNSSAWGRYLWTFQTSLKNVLAFGGKTREESNIPWWGWYRWIPERLRNPLSITYAFVATHNHFVLDRGGKVFKQSAPVIKLPANSTEADHLALLGALNSSTACFWMKQVFQPKAAGGIGRGLEPEPWMERYEHDATKIKSFPVAPNHTATLRYAQSLDAIAHSRAEASIAALLQETTEWHDAATLRAALSTRRASDTALLHQMTALQEELDWLCYQLYGLLDDGFVVAPDAFDPMPPTWLPCLLGLASADAELRAAIALGEDPGETPTAWFERHRWMPVTQLPNDVPPALRERIEKRRQIIQQNPNIALIEKPTFKRRWYNPDYEAEEKAALELWLADAVESAAEKRIKAFTLEQLCVDLQDDSRVLAVAEVLTGRRDFSLTQLVQKALGRDSVPLHPFHVYKESGLTKRAAWEKTWEDQRREDAGEKVTLQVPPTYTSADFLRNEYWQLRGKLDVPKERFIAFTGVPGRSPDKTLYGWAGWTPLQRLKALLAIDEDLEDQGVPLEDRIGLLDSAWRLLPWIAMDDPPAANRLKAELQSLLGPEGPPIPLLCEWQLRFQLPSARSSRGRKSKP